MRVLGSATGFIVLMLISSAHAAEVSGQWLPAPQLRVDGESGWYAETRGRFEMDAVHIRDDNAHHTGGLYDRRARIGLDFGYGEHWSGTMEVDFVDSEEEQFTDMALEYHNHENFRLQLGHFKEYFGMERTASSADALFIERAAIDTFTPQRNLGIQAMGYNARGTASFGAFVDSFENNSKQDDYAFTSRMTYSWPMAEAGLLHLGASGSYREMERVSFSSAPDTASTGLDSVDTGTLLDVDTMLQGGLEAGYAKGNLLLRGEYMATHLDRHNTANALLDGWYMQASWLLSGEPYRYSTAKEALFLPVKPAQPFSLRQGSWGAWELGARYQVLSLNDGSVQGGNMQASTLGLNWYPNTAWRVSANLTYVTTDAEAVTPQDDPVVAAMRMRVSF